MTGSIMHVHPVGVAAKTRADRRAMATRRGAALRWGVYSARLAGRCAVPVARGTGIGVRLWCRWITAPDATDRLKSFKLRAGGTAAAALAAYVAPAPWWAYAAAATTAVVGAGVAGRRPGESITDGLEPPTGVPLLTLTGSDRQLGAQLGQVCAALGLDVQIGAVQARVWGWDVPVRVGHAVGRVTTARQEIEARCGMRPGALSVLPDPDNASMATLRIVPEDPYAQMPPPPDYEPGSLSARGRHPIGRRLDRSDLELTLLAHTGYVGMTRSGKSSAIWTAINVLTAARDAVVWGGDLSDGPALNIWGDCIQQQAATPEALEGLLKAAIAVGMARASVVGRRLRTTADSDLSGPVDENWVPTPEAPALVVVLDEYPLIAAADLGPLVEELLRTGAKAAVYVHIASQRAGRNEMGSTTIRAMLTNRIGLPCEAGDVEMFYGLGRRAAGWRPDLLRPAADGQPNDAGRCYVDAPGQSDPEVSAVYRLDAGQVRFRARTRLRHGGLPGLDRATLEAADAYARRRWDAGLDELLDGGAATAGSGVLRDVRDAIAGSGEDRMRTADLLAALQERDPARYGALDAAGLSALLRPFGVAPGQLGRFAGQANPQGYRLAAVDAAAARQ